MILGLANIKDFWDTRSVVSIDIISYTGHTDYPSKGSSTSNASGNINIINTIGSNVNDLRVITNELLT